MIRTLAMSAMCDTESVCVVAAIRGAGVGCGPFGGTCGKAGREGWSRGPI